MRILKSVLPLVVILILSCGKSNQVKLVETNCNEIVPILGNLTFTFDKDLMPDSVLNRWDAKEYLQFEPAIPGRFMWTSAHELIFSPERELLPATSYKVSFNKELIKYQSKYSISKIEHLTFKTPYAQLENSHTIWAVRDENTKSAGAQMDLYFNYRIAPSKLKSLLTIKVNGVAQEYTIINTTAESKLTLSLFNLKMEDKDYNLSVSIAKGLLPEAGSNATENVIETDLVLPSAFVVYINNIEAEHDGSEGKIKIYASQQIIEQNLEQLIAIEP